MNTIQCMGVALAIAILASACGDNQKAPTASEQAISGADNWAPGKDLTGTQVVIDGVTQTVPDDVAESKRKLDAVATDYEAQIDELERERLRRFTEDDDNRP